jgi:hypothetical protein
MNKKITVHVSFKEEEAHVEYEEDKASVRKRNE